MSQLVLHPSSLDRLDPIAAAIRWWTTQLASLAARPRTPTLAASDVELSDKRLPSRVTIMLGELEGFASLVRLPVASPETHRQALSHKLAELAPISPDALAVSTTAIERNSDGVCTYAVVMARRERLDQLEAAVAKRGVRSARFALEALPDVELYSAAGLRRNRMGFFLDSALALLAVAAVLAAAGVWAAAIDGETEVLAGQEKSLRRAAIAAEVVRKNADVSAQMTERGLLSRRADGALRALALLNQATPDGAWWTRVQWTPAETTISGQASDATAAVRTISEKAPGWSIELAGPLVAAPAGGAQGFEITARPRKDPAK